MIRFHDFGEIDVTQQRNMIMAIVLSALVLIGWSFLSKTYFPEPKAQTAAAAQQASSAPVIAAEQLRNRALVLSETPRVQIRTPRLSGSINLKGGRIDDLVLLDYKLSLKDKRPVRLLSPSGTEDAYFAGFGWSGDGVARPDANTIWTSSSTTLAPGKPVTLSWTNTTGQTFSLTYAIDANYMFSVEQKVSNGGTAPVALTNYALVSRVGESKDASSWTMHTGPIGVFDGAANYDVDFKDLDEAGPAGQTFSGTGGWIGFGDKYWLTALIPDQKASVQSAFRAGNGKLYQAQYSGQPTILAPGKALVTRQQVFAGAKEVKLLDSYEKTLGVPQFDKAIDWGWFYWFERPIFWVLSHLFALVGNFGVAIVLLTLIVRGIMFPIAQKQFKSMAAMRVVQPKMKALQEKHKNDKARLQQEMLTLYQQEKINPLAGCLPILLQIPVFYALYKVLMISIEMRHQPFALWVHDLSAPDPLTPINMFGLLPFDPPGFLHLGVLPILLGITMYLQFKLNPQPMDETQQQVFGIMPWIMMFVMAPFAAGLQLYWVVSNVLTILQQKWLYAQHPGLGTAPAK